MSNKNNSATSNRQVTNRNDLIDIGKLLSILLDGKWFIIFVTALFM